MYFFFIWYTTLRSPVWKENMPKDINSTQEENMTQLNTKIVLLSSLLFGLASKDRCERRRV